METTQEPAIAAPLRETEAAHGAYETDVLGGVFDEVWAGHGARNTCSTTVWEITSLVPKASTSQA